MDSSDNLAKMDRWHSTVLDVHKWSDHPEIKQLTDDLYITCGIYSVDKSGNRKPKKTAQQMLRVLLLDLYVNWLNDPELSIGFSKNKNGYKVGGRYNQVHISPKIIDVERLLQEAGYVDELGFFRDSTGHKDSYTTRIRHTQKLRTEFQKLTVAPYDIDYGVDKELVVLQRYYVPEGEGRKALEKIDYTDTEFTEQTRQHLKTYNDLLKHSFIDIPSLHEPYVLREIKKGKRAGQTQRISIGPENKLVHRVFNGTEEDNWTKGGRFYGGWWLQIPKELRKDIYINDQPTVEVDYKALHPNLLLETPERDPYHLDHLILPEIITEPDRQRSLVKSLILMAINATSPDKAFQAFRNDQKTKTIEKRLKNEQLRLFLHAFTDKYPELKDQLNTGKALELMNMDSTIAALVINQFTDQQIPVLCIHDSFIIQRDKEHQLKEALHVASVQVAGKGIEQDSKSNFRAIKTRIQGNISGYTEMRDATINIPTNVAATDQYKSRKAKFYKWLETTSYSQNSNL